MTGGHIGVLQQWCQLLPGGSADSKGCGSKILTVLGPIWVGEQRMPLLQSPRYLTELVSRLCVTG